MKRKRLKGKKKKPHTQKSKKVRWRGCGRGEQKQPLRHRRIDVFLKIKFLERDDRQL